MRITSKLILASKTVNLENDRKALFIDFPSRVRLTIKATVLPSRCLLALLPEPLLARRRNQECPDWSVHCPPQHFVTNMHET